MRLFPILFTAGYLGFVAYAGRTGQHSVGVAAVALLGGGVLAPVVARLLTWMVGVRWESWPGFMSVWHTAPVVWLVLVEEAGKAVAVLAAYVGLQPQYHSGLDGALFGLGVGAGYALAGQVVSLLEGLPALGVPLHVLGAGLAQAMLPALYGALLGFGREWKLWGQLRWAIGAAGWGAGVTASLAFLHLVRASQVPGPWQVPAAALVLLWEWAPVGLLALVHVWARRRERALLLRFLREEVAADVVTEEEFLALLVDDRGLPRPLRQALVRLASAKWRVVRGLGREDEVEAWRDRVRRLRRAG